jgi:hypothetical protein
MSHQVVRAIRATDRAHLMAITAVYVVLEEISQGHVTRSCVVNLAIGGSTDPGPRDSRDSQRR